MNKNSIKEYLNGDIYNGNTVDELREGKGTMIYFDDNAEKYAKHKKEKKYSGMWKNDKKNGFGKMIYHGVNVCEDDYKEGPIDSMYIGEWKDDKREGKVTMNYGNNESDLQPDDEEPMVYSGMWKNDKKNGYGKMIYYYWNGFSYEGEWKDDKREGKGTMNIGNENIYVGTWENNERKGQGTLIDENNDYQDGFQRIHFTDDVSNTWKNEYTGYWDGEKGKGKITYSSGDKYEGEWISLRKQGYGKLTNAYGHIYEGEWYENKRHGKGRIECLGEVFEVYDGEWKWDKKDGKGRMVEFYFDKTVERGDIYDGDWKNDKKEGKGRMEYDNNKDEDEDEDEDKENKSVYVGDWKDDKRDGIGRMEYKGSDGCWKGMVNNEGDVTVYSGEIYEGDWKNDKREGKGKMVYKNGDVYEGDWKNNKREGRGRMEYKNGELYNGKWTDNEKKEKVYNSDCCLCLESVNQNNNNIIVTKCGHIFHASETENCTGFLNFIRKSKSKNCSLCNGEI